MELSEAQLEALAEAIARRLLEEPHLTRLAQALAGRSGANLEPLAVLPSPSAAASGPEPIGPYEIPPEFDEVKWDGEPPTMGEWGPSAPPGAAEAAAGPRISRGAQRRSRPRRE